MADTQRRLAWHGMLLFLLGLLTFLIALAAVWGWVTLTPTTAATYWLAVGGSYANCIFLLLAGVFGTSRSTPLHGAGHAGSPWQESLVYAGLAAGALAVLVASALVLWGLRRR